MGLPVPYSPFISVEPATLWVPHLYLACRKEPGVHARTARDLTEPDLKAHAVAVGASGACGACGNCQTQRKKEVAISRR